MNCLATYRAWMDKIDEIANENTGGPNVWQPVNFNSIYFQYIINMLPASVGKRM